MDLEVEQNHMTRQEALDLIIGKVSCEDNVLLDCVPGDEEIKRVVFAFPKEKSPGLDGVTVEMIRKRWNCMKEAAAIWLSQALWTDGKMMSRPRSAGVNKLIPKNDDTQELSNWQPLTMLTMTKRLLPN